MRIIFGRMENSNRKTVSFVERALNALDSSFRKLVLERRKTNDTLVLWQDGKSASFPQLKFRSRRSETARALNEAQVGGNISPLFRLVLESRGRPVDQS